MKVLIVDNKDSFTYNLKNYLLHFCSHVDVFRHDLLNLKIVSSYDKILFSPGPGLPKEYPILHHILHQFGKSKSILGVCLGQQAIATFYGAKLYNLNHPMHGVSSTVHHLENCTLYNSIPSVFKIGHYHSWVVSKKDFPQDLQITSLNDEGLIMSISHITYDVKGIQFHPESVLTDHGLNLIRNWLIS